MDKQTVERPSNRTLHSIKKAFLLHAIARKKQKNYAEWKRPDGKSMHTVQLHLHETLQNVH